MPTVKVIGKKVVLRGSRNYIMVPKVGVVFISKDHGLKEGDPIHGDVTYEEKEIKEDKDAKPLDPKDYWKRNEMTDYTSSASTIQGLEDDMSIALVAAKVKAISKLEFKASDFAGAFAAPAIAAPELGVS